MVTRGKFGKPERSARVSRGAAESSSNYLRLQRCGRSHLIQGSPLPYILGCGRWGVICIKISHQRSFGSWFIKGRDESTLVTYEFCAAKHCKHKWWNRELTLMSKLKCFVKPMKDPLSVSPSKGNKGTTRGKEKKIQVSGVRCQVSTCKILYFLRLPIHTPPVKRTRDRTGLGYRL